MKNALFAFAFCSLFAFTASAQVPQAFKYQAVVRNASGEVLANQNVGLKIRLTPADTTVTLYEETHTITTNAFGLVNLNAGRGTIVSGQFGTIDWEQPVYIHLGLDVNGGAAYEAMGFSELLSVPYALYAANTAGYSGLPADADKGDLLYYDGSAWRRLIAGAAGAVLTMGTNGLPVWKVPEQLDSLIKVTMTNGDVIYASPVDNNGPNGVRWGPKIDITALVDYSAASLASLDFKGEANTEKIVAQLGSLSTPYAAKVCADLVAYGFDDWYLPAGGELKELFLSLGPNGSGQITSGIYWSSSELSTTNAWGRTFDGGIQVDAHKNSNLFRCRCVRR